MIYVLVEVVRIMRIVVERKMNMLTLPIKKKWFDMIKSGEKKEEYREIKPYYESRFFNSKKDENGEYTFQRNMWVIFRNGYSKNSPSIKCYVSIVKNYGNPEWGAEKDRLYYALKILSVEKVDD